MSVSRTLLCTVALCAACETGPGPRSERAGAPEIREQPVTEADSLYRSGEFTAARQIWTDQLASAWNRGDSAQAARLLTSLGLVARQLGDYAESRQVGLEALDLKTRLGLREDLFRSYNALGLLAWTRGDLDEASTMFDRASAAAAEVGDDLSVAKAAANMAHVHNERGEPYRARDGFMALARASRAAGDMVTLGRTLINLAMLDIGSAIRSPRRRCWKRHAPWRRPPETSSEGDALGQLATALSAMGAAAAGLRGARHGGEPGRGARSSTAGGGGLETARGSLRRGGGRSQGARVLRSFAAAERRAGPGRGIRQRERQRSPELPRSGHADASARARRALDLHRSGGFRGGELEDCIFWQRSSLIGAIGRRPPPCWPGRKPSRRTWARPSREGSRSPRDGEAVGSV